MFYEFRQNNSGGGFDFEEGRLTHFVIVEADNVEDANAKLISLGGYFNGVDDNIDCECCGDRWYPLGSWGSDPGTERPEIYGKSPDEADIIKWMGGKPEIYVHYKDGTVTAHWA